MAIHLITGSPGAGKTLFSVQHLIENLIPTGRPIYTTIDGLTVDADNVFEGDGNITKEWWSDPKYEDGTIFVFDEIQQDYPVRNAMSKVPKYLSQYEVHRHRGFDFVFITQAPRLVDRHVHDLITLHTHFYRPFNMSRSIKYEWNAVNPQPNPAQTRATAVRNTFVFPKKYFKYYKSASLHNVKLRIPLKPILYIFLLLLAGGGTVYWIKHSFENLGQQPDLEASFGGPTVQCDYRSYGYANGGYLLRTVDGRIFTADISKFDREEDGKIVYVHEETRGTVCRS